MGRHKITLVIKVCTNQMENIYVLSTNNKQLPKLSFQDFTIFVSDLPLLSLRLQMFLLWSILPLHRTCEIYSFLKKYNQFEKYYATTLHYTFLEKYSLSKTVSKHVGNVNTAHCLSSGEDLHKVLSTQRRKVTFEHMVVFKCRAIKDLIGRKSVKRNFIFQEILPGRSDCPPV